MTSAVMICSNALLMLGDKPISSFTENSDRARLAANLYAPVRDFLLRSHPWHCAIRRVVLSPATTAPAFDYANRFLLPGDCIRVLSVGEKGFPENYELEGRYILSDSTALKLRYVFRNDDERSWDPMLVQVATEAMRRVFAYGITDSGNLEQMLLGVLADLLRHARAVDGQETPPETLGNEQLFQAGF